ncbi:MAG: polymer-forming cytoskeletal protein [Acidobacteriota bacterium]
MTSFEKKDQPPDHADRLSHLGPNIVLQGELGGKEDLVLHGRVVGKIDLPESDVLVAEQGRLEAEVHVRNITVRGEVNGNITASGKVIIEKTGRVKGDLAALVISVEDGAQFKGSVRTLGKA